MNEKEKQHIDIIMSWSDLRPESFKDVWAYEKCKLAILTYHDTMINFDLAPVDIKEKYLEWCEETNRHKGTWYNGTIQSFFKWLDNQETALYRKQLKKTKELTDIKF